MSTHEITLRFLAEPTAVNLGGNVFGGSVMKWIDHAGFSCATNWSHSYCVTAYVGGIRFFEPIQIGNLIEVTAELMYTGNTSMHISISVYARDPKAEQARFTTHCILVYVAVDENGRPTPVPAFTPKTQQDQRLNDHARKMIELRQGMEAEADAFLRKVEQDSHDD